MRLPRNVLAKTILAAAIAGACIGNARAASPPAEAAMSAHSDIGARDEVVVFETAARLSDDGSEWIVPLHVWVYQPVRSTFRAAVASTLMGRMGAPVPADKQPLFEERANLLFADNERGRLVVVTIAGRRFKLPGTAPNGHARGEARVPRSEADAAAIAGALQTTVVLPAGDVRSRSGRAYLVPPNGLSVISDIDDTVKITHVTDRARMLAATFLQPFAPVPGMSELYAGWTTGAEAKGAVSAFHFVSSSPWHLYAPLHAFLTASKFPTASLTLKHVRLKDRTRGNLFKPGLETKPPEIERLLREFPRREFILVGDNGEQDPEVYGLIARRHPDRIRAIYIRVLPDKPEARASRRLAEAFKDVPFERWRLFREPSELRELP